MYCGVTMCKNQIVDTGLPERVIQLYLENGDDNLITRLKGIVKKSVQNPVNNKPAKSKEIKSHVEDSFNCSTQMKYAGKKTPHERRKDAIKKKIEVDFVLSSDSDESEDGEKEKRPTKKKKIADTHEAH